MGRLIAVLFVMAYLAHGCSGAERVDARRMLQRILETPERIPQTLTPFRFKRDASRLKRSELDDALSLGDDATLQIVRTTTTAQGTKLFKMQEKFKGQIVPDGIVTIETNPEEDHVLDVSGTVYRNIGHDLDEHTQLSQSEALDACISHNNDMKLRDNILNVKVEPEILFDDEQTAYLAYFTQYLVLTYGDERRPTCLLDARDAHVTMAWDALDKCIECRAKGTGGNRKIGKIRYGELTKCLDLRRENDTCFLENKYVRVFDNRLINYTEPEDLEGEEVASYDCREMDDEVNGAYSPLLDALFYGTVVGRMYETWYNTSALEETIVFRVHWGVNETNAHWTGEECQFGDGADEYHPLVSADIVGHEIGHGVTERYSNLYYFHQFGGINEAFSDMAGETAEAYMREADWVMGLDVSKSQYPLRYFDDPSKDNRSISHVDDYDDFMDPHLSSGPYNRVFYILVHDLGVPIRDAFHTFLHANQMYWHHMSTFKQAACDVLKSAYDLGQDGSPYLRAFSQVGIEVCALDDHIVGLKNKVPEEGITVSRQVNPLFVFGFPGEFAESVNIKAESEMSEVYITVSDEPWASSNNTNSTVFAEGPTFVQFDVPGNNSVFLSIRLSSSSATLMTDVVLTASWSCREDYSDDFEDKESFLRFVYWYRHCRLVEEEESR